MSLRNVFIFRLAWASLWGDFGSVLGDLFDPWEPFGIIFEHLGVTLESLGRPCAALGCSRAPF